MENEELIAMEVYCDHEGVEVSFVEALHDRGLSHLLGRMEALQQDMRSLSERLRLYE